MGEDAGDKVEFIFGLFALGHVPEETGNVFSAVYDYLARTDVCVKIFPVLPDTLHILGKRHLPTRLPFKGGQGILKSIFRMQIGNSHRYELFF